MLVPEGQLCCGALAAHAGVRDVARQLARENLRAFVLVDVDAIVTNAAGCGSTLKEYDHLFTLGEPEYTRAAAFGKKARDVTEFLAAIGLCAPLKALPLRVTYQDSCHLLHGQKVREAPRELLRSIPGLDLVELPHSELCCGSAGVYNVTQTDASLELLAEKMRFSDAGADHRHFKFGLPAADACGRGNAAHQSAGFACDRVVGPSYYELNGAHANWRYSCSQQLYPNLRPS